VLDVSERFKRRVFLAIVEYRQVVWMMMMMMIEPFTHVEHRKDADPFFKNLLIEGSKIQKLTPTTGSEIILVSEGNNFALGDK
jgi:hypothetical protein